MSAPPDLRATPWGREGAGAQPSEGRSSWVHLKIEPSLGTARQSLPRRGPHGAPITGLGGVVKQRQSTVREAGGKAGYPALRETPKRPVAIQPQGP